MPVSKTKVLTLTFAAILVVATLDAAAARHRKHQVRTGSAEAAFWSELVPMENGVPVIMKGYHPPGLTPEAQPRQRADRPVRIPRGSSTYIPPPNPSPYSSNSPPAAALTQPAPAPYQPPKINTFSDRVTNCTQSYTFNRGIGNNPTDQQSYIRQCAN